jgi:hypothetical protein
MHYYAGLNEDIISQKVKNVQNSESVGNKIKDDETTSLLDRYKQERDKDLQMYAPKAGY